MEQEKPFGIDKRDTIESVGHSEENLLRDGRQNRYIIDIM